MTITEVLARPDAHLVLDNEGHILPVGKHIDLSPVYYVKTTTGVVKKQVNLPAPHKAGVGATPLAIFTPAQPADAGTITNYDGHPLWTLDIGTELPIAWDIEQGQREDCYFLAPILSLRLFAEWFLPFILQRTLPTGYRAIFRTSYNGTPPWFQVNLDGNLGDAGAKPNPNDGAIGPLLLERAYAFARTYIYFYGFPGAVNTYASLDWGWPGITYLDFGLTVLGLGPTDPGCQTALMAAMALNQPTSMCTNGSIVGGAPLVAAHCYAVLGVDASGNVTVANPWGPNYDNHGTDTMPWEQFVANIASIATVTGYPVTKPAQNADANLDGVTDNADMVIQLTHSGLQVPPGLEGDANGDGTVNNSDFVVLLTNYGTQDPT